MLTSTDTELHNRSPSSLLNMVLIPSFALVGSLGASTASSWESSWPSEEPQERDKAKDS
jgi:hypothetical protein